MTHVSDTGRVVLTAAARREDLSVLPFPDSVKAKGAAVQKVLAGLSGRGLIRVVQTEPQLIVITSEGMAAIGIEPEARADNSGDTEAADVTADTDTVAPKPTIRAGTKQALLIEMLKRPEGATAEQIAERTGWRHHSIRGAIAGALKKKLGFNVEATRVRNVGPNQTGAKGSTTIYRITEAR
jgi:hypothetical protein